MPDHVEPEEVTRKDFLGLWGIGSAAAAILFSTIGMLRLPKPRVLPEVSTVIRLGKAGAFPPGSVKIIPEHKLQVVATDGGIAVLSLICTHLGCIVKETAAGFDCPCHGSKFGPEGKVLGGPAPSPLQWLAVSQAPDGTLLVDRAREVEPGTVFKV